jgi:hypothetical protein
MGLLATQERGGEYRLQASDITGEYASMLVDVPFDIGWVAKNP